MYYNDCTAGYAAEVIREILDNADHPRDALWLIELFITNQYTTDDIGNEL